MKKQLFNVLNLGQMAVTPANEKGVHFIAKVVEFGERKEVCVCCPKDGTTTHKIPLHSGLYGQLKEFDSEELFLLIERKGPVLQEIFKLKDYAGSSSIWKGDSYEPKLESVLIELQPTTLALVEEEI